MSNNGAISLAICYSRYKTKYENKVKATEWLKLKC